MTTTNTEHTETKNKIERLGMLLLEHSEKVAQLCVKESSVEELDAILTIIDQTLNIQKT